MFLSDIDEVREVLKISSSVDFDVLKPILESVDREFLRPVLGTQMHDALQAFYDSGIVGTIPPGSSSEAMTKALGKLVKLAQSAEIHLAYWYGFDLLNVQIMNDGFKRTETEKVKGLFKYQEDNLKEFFKHAGFNGLDTMLEYMDGNDRFCFPEFHENETGKHLKEMFIPRTDIFDQYYYLGNSRLLFMRLKPHMKVVEDLRIRIVLGNTNYNFIKAEMLKEEPEAKVVAILPFIRRPISYFSTALLMEETGSDLSDKGLVFEGIKSNYNDHSNKGPSTESRIIAMIQRNKNLGDSYLSILRNYLIENAEDWNGYTQPRSGIVNRDNKGKKTFWA
jgi:hypothetical protein